MATCTELQTRLDTLLAARDKIAIGTQVVRVRYADKDIQYGQSDGKRLDSLIADVRATMARQRCAGCSGARRMLHVTPSDGNGRRGWPF